MLGFGQVQVPACGGYRKEGKNMRIIIDYRDFKKELPCTVRPGGKYVLHFDSDISKEDNIGYVIYSYLWGRFQEIGVDTERYIDWCNGNDDITTGMILRSMGDAAKALGAEAFRLADLLNLALPETYVKPKSIFYKVESSKIQKYYTCKPKKIYRCYQDYFLESPSAIRAHCQDIIKILKKQYKQKNNHLALICQIDQSLDYLSDLSILPYRYLRDFINGKDIAESVQQDIIIIMNYPEINLGRNYTDELQILEAILKSAKSLNNSTKLTDTDELYE